MARFNLLDQVFVLVLSLLHRLQITMQGISEIPAKQIRSQPYQLHVGMLEMMGRTGRFTFIIINANSGSNHRTIWKIPCSTFFAKRFQACNKKETWICKTGYPFCPWLNLRICIRGEKHVYQQLTSKSVFMLVDFIRATAFLLKELPRKVSTGVLVL